MTVLAVAGRVAREIVDSLRRCVAPLPSRWERFWLEPSDPVTLGLVRIATGLVLLAVYAASLPDAARLIGGAGWVDREAIDALRELDARHTDLASRLQHGWWAWSVWFLADGPLAVWGGQAVFLAAIVSFTLGWSTRTAGILVWAGHVSFAHRSFAAWFGVDAILAMLTLYLMLGPSGAALSLDARRKPVRPTAAATLAVRAIQIHLCIVYLSAGLSKLQGATWWDGTAIWLVAMNPELGLVDFGVLARLGDWAWLPVSTAAVGFTLAFEVSFPFLVWGRATRPLVLAAAAMLHLGIGVVLGLGAFGAAMVAAALAFVPPGWLRRAIEGAAEPGFRPVAGSPARRAA